RPSTEATRRTTPRVTSRTPQQASTTRASAVAAGTRPASWALASSPTAPGAFPCAHGWWPATAESTAAATPTPTTAPNVRRGSAIAGGPRGLLREQDVGVEAGVVSGVAGRPLLVHGDQQRVAVAVQADLAHPLPVA